VSYSRLAVTFFFFLFSADCRRPDKEVSQSSLAVTVGYVSEAHVVEGCGCSFYWPGEENKEGKKSIYSSNSGETIWMNLDGKDVQLKQKESTESMENIKKGGRYYEIYKYAEMTIRIDYHVTWTCEADMPESESCEVTHYDLKITFNRNGRQKTIQAKGVCGC
jgi:hypothetical protein